MSEDIAGMVSERIEIESPLRVYTTFVGCKVSQADAEAAAEVLVLKGLPVVARPEEADVCLVMTCCVTAEAEKKSRKLARRLAGDGRRVLVAGCAAAREAGQFDGPGVEVTEGRDWAELAAALVSRHGPTLGRDEAVAAEIAAAATTPVSPRTRYTLKVQDGCAGTCTYCIVRTVRGRPRSVPLPDVVRRARAAVEGGCGEIVLSGINLGSYRDEGPGGTAGLAELIVALAEVPGLARLRLSSLEPDAVDERLLDALAHPRVARHLHLPLQSADDRVLRAMGRPYGFASYRQTVALVRAVLPDVMLSTDIIVGFPAEDDVAFEGTLGAIEEGLFGRVHVFAYSARPGTPAERLGRLPAPVVKTRKRLAGEAAAGALRRTAAQAVGRPAQVLVEDRRDGLWRGYSSQYVRYHLRGEARPGALVHAVGGAADGDVVHGRIEAILA